MRALGPGSVSSLLKVGLDLVYVVLWIGLFGAVFILLGSLVIVPLIPVSELNININGENDPETVRRFIRGPALPLLFGSGALYIGGLVIIVGRLRQVFETLTRGDPFQPLNVSRLRVVGLALAGLEIWNFVVPPIIRSLVPGEGGDGGRTSFTGWFAVLVVFVLAEVFREGARLRREAELTI
jgi:hypothetical protein